MRSAVAEPTARAVFTILRPRPSVRPRMWRGGSPFWWSAFITFGLDDWNPMWPFFRLSHFGQETLDAQKPYRFHDVTGYLAMIKAEVPDISAEAADYLEEAIASFFADCLLASCVMLGVAAEAEFSRLVDAAIAGPASRSFRERSEGALYPTKNHEVSEMLDADALLFARRSSRRLRNQPASYPICPTNFAKRSGSSNRVKADPRTGL